MQGLCIGCFLAITSVFYLGTSTGLEGERGVDEPYAFGLEILRCGAERALTAKAAAPLNDVNSFFDTVYRSYMRIVKQ